MRRFVGGSRVGRTPLISAALAMLLALTTAGLMPVLAADIAPDFRLNTLASAAPLASSDLAPDRGCWQVGLSQQALPTPPRNGLAGFDLNETALNVSFERGLGEIAPEDLIPAPELMGEARVSAGALYGTPHAGGGRATGGFVQVEALFGLTPGAPAGQSPPALTLLAGLGTTGAVLSLSGPGPNADLYSTYTYLLAGVQAREEPLVSPALWFDPYLLARIGCESSLLGRRQATTMRTWGFYRVDAGCTLTFQLGRAAPAAAADDDGRANQAARADGDGGGAVVLRAAVEYADDTGFAPCVTFAYQRRF
ncbi:MAG: hypothetical protein ACREJ2_08285 [Planctomycetota bacterium]